MRVKKEKNKAVLHVLLYIHILQIASTSEHVTALTATALYR